MDAIHDTRKAMVATHAVGTWKKTMRADSPAKPSADGA
jgi:hypothetical protein